MTNPAFIIQEAIKEQERAILVEFRKSLSFAYLAQLERALTKMGWGDRTVVILDMSKTASFLKYAVETYASSLTKLIGTQRVVIAGLSPEIVEYVVKRRKIPVQCFEPDVATSLGQRGFSPEDFPGLNADVKGTGLFKSIARWFGSRDRLVSPRQKQPHEVGK